MTAEWKGRQGFGGRARLRYSRTEGGELRWINPHTLKFTVSTLPDPSARPRVEQASSPINPSPLPDRQAGYQGEGKRERLITS